MEDKFMYIMKQMIATQDKLIQKALDQTNYLRAAEMEIYKSGLEQAVANYEVTRPDARSRHRVD